MPFSITKTFHINQALFDKTGAFDAALDVDTRLFVDPKLLLSATSPEFMSSREKVNRHFKNILLLIKTSKNIDDVFWKRAKSFLVFSELRGFNFGYSSTGGNGSGMGAIFQDLLLKNAKDIIEAGFENPEIFEIAGLLEPGIGCDRISDMVCKILYDDFLAYSSRVFSELGQTFDYSFDGRRFNIPRNPFRENEPVILCPKEILNDLPSIEKDKHLMAVCFENERVRRTMSSIVGDSWKEEMKRITQEKREKDFIFENVELLRGVVEHYLGTKRNKYNYSFDPSGEANWLRYAELILAKFGNSVSFNPSSLDLESEVGNIVSWFRQLIENNGLWELLYREDGSPRPERAAQLVFNAVCILLCHEKGILVARESNSGAGPVDFSLANGDGKVLVELKLSRNSKLVHCYEIQIPAYWRSEQANSVVMLILLVKEKSKKDKSKTIFPDIINALLERSLREYESVPFCPKVELINALPRKSASHR